VYSLACGLLFALSALRLAEQGLASAKIGHTPGSIGRNSAFVVREDAKNIGEILCREKSLRDPPGEKFLRNVYLVGSPNLIFSICTASCPADHIPKLFVACVSIGQLLNKIGIREVLAKHLV